MIAATTSRVRDNTDAAVNDQIREHTRENLMRCVQGGVPAINRRLAALDEEWDIERALETMAPTVTLTGLFLGLTVSRKWLIIPALVNGFFLQHAIEGWCPPLPVLRRLGFRTAEEIDRERYALKAMRGDFQNTPLADQPASAGPGDHALVATER